MMDRQDQLSEHRTLQSLRDKLDGTDDPGDMVNLQKAIKELKHKVHDLEG